MLHLCVLAGDDDEDDDDIEVIKAPPTSKWDRDDSESESKQSSPAAHRTLKSDKAQQNLQQTTSLSRYDNQDY